ncbi:MAG: PKD domain-containing protein, partial [Proteobacteria bacterium]|nr:PKD domain-containing protein [Pseudomonadota bacterium]
MKYVLNQNPMNTANKQIRKMIRFIASSILCALILHMLAVRANALDVGLQWDTNNDAEYYVVYYGTDSGNYTAETEQIPAPQIQYAFSGLADTTWYFAVKAFNSCGNSSDFSDEVVYSPTSTPAPSPLTAAIESPSQDVSIIEGASVNFQGYVTGGTTPYAYNWYFDNSGASERSVEDPGSVTFTSAGTYDVTFTVDDNTGNSVSATVRVNVASAYVDVNPTASIASPSANVSITAGGSVNFQASVSSGNAPLTHAWNFGTGGPSARTVEDPGSVTFPTAGSYTVTYTVRDNDGDTSSDTVLVTVNAAYVDVNPTASITSPSANVSITAGGSVNFQASVSSGNAPLTHAWNFGTGGPSART